MSRQAQVARRTAETDVTVTVELDGEGLCQAASGVGFLDHMLAAFARTALCDLSVRASGDLHVDAHHTVEDVGLVLGQALRAALGERSGLRRYGWALVPMDEALCQVALDLSNRPLLAWQVPLPPGAAMGAFAAELGEEFWRALASQAGCTLHVRALAGGNAHHVLEAVSKACGLAWRQAVERDPRIRGPLSTKGVLA
jgi:imidazoleglycerol-phosphate dehydratase